ncbi:MAG: HAD-IIA family hydrolase [Clostridiales bacterium]|nr:HAD-IIA family hydrolase [Clostridiales bacterium]
MDGMKEVLKKVKYILLDMDGTVYLGGRLIGEMDKTLDALRAAGKKLVYLTNNSSKSVENYYDKLKKMNLLKIGDEVKTSGTAAIGFLKTERRGKTVRLLGTESLKKEFVESGINVVENGVADICILAYDTDLSYVKLCKFTDNLRENSEYIATHPDINCPSDNYPLPDVGSFIELIKASTGRTPDKIIGKPYMLFGAELMKEHNACPDDFMMVGDRLYTDIAFGVNCGFHTLFVLSGEGTADMIADSEKKPEFVLDSLNDIVSYL